MSLDEMMKFPKTFEEYAKQYGFKDTEEHYTNGSELIPVFRVNQWLEHSAYKLAKVTMPEVIDTILESIKKEFSPVVGEYMTQEIWEIIDKHKLGGDSKAIYEGLNLRWKERATHESTTEV